MYRVLVFGLLAGPNGVSTAMMNLYRNMDKSKVQWDFVMFKEYYDAKTKKTIPGTFAEEILSMGGRIHYLNYAVGKYPKSSRKKMRELLALPDVMGVHCHDISGNGYPLYLAKEMDKPIRIIQFHTGCPRSELESRIQKATRSRKAQVRMISGKDYDRWACNDYGGEAIYLGQPFEVFPNAVDTKKFSYNAVYRELIFRQLDIPSDAVVFGFLATIYHIKNPIFAIKVFEEYHKKNPNSRFIMVGSGEMHEEVREYVKKRRLKRCVHVIGQQIQADMFYSAFDLFLCPSQSEGFPNTLVEAQCAGCQCLVSDEVTQLVKLTELVEFASLKDSPKVWAEKANEMIQRAGPRRTWNEEIKEAGYDIQDAADKLTKHYLKRIKAWERKHKNGK